ncbi:MAG TPA: hypothetical protein VJ919_17900 [Tangfeifania sp.]|nr:hypothetical protein [Tangfeifania sp.]
MQITRLIAIRNNLSKTHHTSDEVALPADKIFKRFNKNQNKKGSTGLGLAIVKAIADVSGLRVSYSYTNSGNHRIKVSL